MSQKQLQPGDRYQSLLQLLRTSETIWNASRIFFERWDLSPSQFNVLNVLQDHPGGVTQIELSRTLITHRSNVTGLVDRLEKRGLLRRGPVPGDRRAYFVLLTPAGRKLLEQILPEYYERSEAALADLPIKQLPALKKQLARIEAAANQIANSISAS